MLSLVAGDRRQRTRTPGPVTCAAFSSDCCLGAVTAVGTVFGAAFVLDSGSLECVPAPHRKISLVIV